MSRFVAFAAIQGGYNVVSKVEGMYNKALESHEASTKVGFPNTAYYLPITYSLTGNKVETLEDLKKPLDYAKRLLPPHMKGKHHLPYLAPLLNSGMAAVFACEILEALNYLNNPDFYLASSEDIDQKNNKIWLGAPDDDILGKVGKLYVDGSIKGFATIVGATPDPETAKMIVEGYKEKGVAVLLAANQNGTSVTEQLLQAGVKVGWGEAIVPLGPEISAAAFALGFACRAAMALGGFEPGDYNNILLFNKEKVMAFVNALGDVSAEWAAAAAGAVNWGFPTIADTDIPGILPTGICPHEHVVGNVAHDQIVQKSLEVRGIVQEKKEEPAEKKPAEKKVEKGKVKKIEVTDELEKKWAKERAQREKEEEKIRQQRREEREKRLAQKAMTAQKKSRKMHPAREQKAPLDKLLNRSEHFERIKW